MHFTDSREAGRQLAPGLEAFSETKDVALVAIAAGGVPVGAEIAKQLRLPLDLLFIRRLLTPDGPQTPVAAVNVCGTLVIDKALPTPPAVPESPLDYFVADALRELARRERVCRGGRPALELAQKTVLLVDNGIRTGSTVQIAVRALRELKPARIVLAVPVAAPESRARVESVVDELICLAWPEPFAHVGMFYSNFARPTDEQISQAMSEISDE